MNEADQRYDQIVRKLQEHNHKLTPQRLAVAKILVQSQDHPNVEAIFEKLKKDFPTMSLATVYRNVMLFKSLGEVLEIGFPDGSNRYDGNKPYPHPHVVCVQCKRIIDPDLTTLQNLTEEVGRKTGFRILTHRLDFFGVCSDCLHNEKQ
jgi:Fur family transcriptional regulator, peroxide stress response regulator